MRVYLGDLERLKPFCKLSLKLPIVPYLDNESRHNVTFEDLPISNLGLTMGHTVGYGQVSLKRSETSQAG